MEKHFDKVLKTKVQQEVWIREISERYIKKFYLRLWLNFRKIRKQEEDFEKRRQKVRNKAFSILEEMDTLRYVPGSSITLSGDYARLNNEKSENFQTTPLSSRSLNSHRYEELSVKTRETSGNQFSLNAEDYLDRNIPIYKGKRGYSNELPIDRTETIDFESELNEIFSEDLGIYNAEHVKAQEEN